MSVLNTEAKCRDLELQEVDGRCKSIQIGKSRSRMGRAYILPWCSTFGKMYNFYCLFALHKSVQSSLNCFTASTPITRHTELYK